MEINKSDIPYGIMLGGFHIELFGSSKISVEGKYMILEYSSETVRIKLGKKNLIIMGNNLSLGSAEEDGFSLSGNIISLTFE